ncbi:MAG: META domain-containing protein [Methanoregula sp.]|nr:META domain-containing protein [Methanoregula sp.]
MDEQTEPGPDESKLPLDRFRTIGAIIVIAIAVSFIFIFLLGLTTAQSPILKQSSNLTAVTYRDATGIEIPVSNAGDITVRFERNGNISGFSGCNEFISAYLVNKQQIAIVYPIHTNETCTDPGIMEQETMFYRDMAQATSFKTSAVGMTLYNGEGKILIEFQKW